MSGSLPGDTFFAYVDDTLLGMFVIDGSGEEVLSDIISHEKPRLGAADDRLAGYGYTRTEKWQHTGPYWTAIVVRSCPAGG